MEPDPDLVEALARREPSVRRGEPQAYKRAVIRMTLQNVQKRREALDELARLGELMEPEDG